MSKWTQRRFHRGKYLLSIKEFSQKCIICKIKKLMNTLIIFSVFTFYLMCNHAFTCQKTQYVCNPFIHLLSTNPSEGLVSHFSTKFQVSDINSLLLQPHPPRVLQLLPSHPWELGLLLRPEQSCTTHFLELMEAWPLTMNGLLWILVMDTVT